MKKNNTPDATELLQQDHETVKELFADFKPPQKTTTKRPKL